ncbi:proline--tRNA ligase [Borrelia miyamotoi]|uniref:Proline--tRNA ligase n=1 Tax=Borrelia miyamotoi TaxID=47466 RepID=A0AAX3JLS0_9SPIR|nr:proline--tRNA ligase [Borrelia miyamotoi]QFP41933.1 proline--tRNA ligase [Borrelia miyamotoi]QFP48051.1 proline--tRNA ligase [Borrelia miyamotoi]QGT55810.1 proline--tRNA ligase [Borrelia miyamotoi]QGT56589.1 proline--tRNA ligase [Borrelia miyamotoi]WAZ71847.1 proline--tRNA ligase [Borrelia miyamotoi]
MGNFIFSKEEDFSRWYLDIVQKAKLADYGPVKGCMVIMPYGYAIWERIKSILNDNLKKTGHENAYFPLLIPYEFLEKEKEHIKGFSPELAVVTTAGGEELSEPLILRPTSETVIWNMYSKWIKSYRDLPVKINQWTNIIRWEKRTRPFLRTTEFLWQEGHTAHETEKEAKEETLFILNLYKRFIEDYLAIPVFCGQKTEMEKFAGAVSTYTLEALMQDKKALQAGTSHYLGLNFAEAFDVKFQNKKGEMNYVFATSWGVSTRLIGALIMVHSDNKGLILPPKIAPIEIIIVPIFKVDDEANKRILEYSTTVFNILNREGFRVEIDKDVKNSPGFRFAAAELKGIPVRIEIGSNDILMDCVTVARRDKDKNSKYQVSMKELLSKMRCELEDMQSELFNRALEFRNLNTKEIIGFKENDYDTFKTYINNHLGFVLSSWCGSEVCEEGIKNDTKATIRCIPEEFQNRSLNNLTCIYCNGVVKYLVLFARSY